MEPYKVFMGGRSVMPQPRLGRFRRWWLMGRVWQGLQEGDLVAPAQICLVLRLRHFQARRTLIGHAGRDDITMVLDRSRNLGELIRWGQPAEQLRAYLVEALKSSEIAFLQAVAGCCAT